MKPSPLPKLRLAAIISGGALLLLILLALDLTNHGVAWRLFWSLTGEETPLAQVRGMVEWAGSLIRQQSDTAPGVPINHTTENPFGINTFLEQEVEPAKREQQIQMIADAGFGWIRQEFAWEDIEVHGRGDYEDRRNDLDGDGQPDAVDAWAKYDQIVDLADQYGLQIQARLSNPPDWTHANPDIGDKAPPDDVQDFVNYAVTLAERYKGRVRYFQIWNEPNIYPEWGNQPVNPEAYTDLLCRTYAALKAVDPDNVIIAAALAPTVSLSPENLNDFVFLQRMYDAGAGECFDIMAAQGYGLNSGPTDHRMRPTTVNFAHNVYIRDLMVANGDAEKPIWISEMGWNTQPDDPAIVTSQSGEFGIVTEEQRAQYTPLAYQRAQQEWPWVGVMNFWFFKRAADYEQNQAFYYFRMVEPDFTPLPVYDAMKQYIRDEQPMLYPGIHQAEEWGIQAGAEQALVDFPGAEFGQVLQTDELTFTVYGTSVVLYWRGGGETLYVEIDGKLDLAGGQCNHPLADDELHFTAFCLGLTAGEHTLRVTPVVPDLPLYIDSVEVLDRSFQNVAPLVGGALSLLFVAGVAVVNGLRERRRRVS
ncbi:MAG: cellulase family glycosylhydrolase [Anaerolineaceae bacterium]|nr:cellulase family glycosylhydrolase [Anaerolineaceae bacterium]